LKMEVPMKQFNGYCYCFSQSVAEG